MKLLPLLKLLVIIIILSVSYLLMDGNEDETAQHAAISSGRLKYEKGNLTEVQKQALREKTIFLNHIKK